MLKWRVLTAVVLIPLLVYGVLFGSTSTLGWVFAGVIVVGASEWANFTSFHSAVARLAYSGVVAAVMVAVNQFLTLRIDDWYFLLPGVSVWAIALVWMVLANPAAVDGIFSTLVKLLAGLVMLVSAWLSVLGLHGMTPSGPVLLMGLLVMIWAADSGAYFVGRKWGHRKLAPGISPGKTREGVFGGVMASLPVIAVTGWLVGWRNTDLLLFAVIAVATIVISVAGDLFESLMKRQRGIKDSGRILPGHGGVLDRIDSLLSASPAFAVGLSALGLLPPPAGLSQ